MFLLTNAYFSDKIESIQYNIGLISGAIKGMSRVKLYHELGLEKLRLEDRCEVFVTITNYQ